MRAGVIGLGAMGLPMAHNLEQAGLLRAVWNRTAARAQGQFPDPVRVATSPAELARECEFILSCVSRDEDLLEVMEALLPGVPAGLIVADASTVSSETALRAAALLRQRQAHFLDCPVSGGVEGAQQGTLSMMVGGAEEILARARPALNAVAGNIVHMGATGSGQATKAVNQLMAAGINQAVTEALAFGCALGLDMDRVIGAVSRGAAANWFLQRRGLSMLQGNFAPGFRLALHQKDLRIIERMAAQANCSLPVTERSLADYRELLEQGEGDADISVLFKLKRRLCDGTPGAE